MDANDKVMVMCEMEQSAALAFLERCEAEGVSFLEKVEQLMQNFLGKGDNHLLEMRIIMT